LNLKFKGNSSFVPFSNLDDADTPTKVWKVCTKVASFLEQGQRLENLNWRLWHLQNFMVDTDNAKSKRDFKELSKCMSDKLDEEKGRIEELQAPGFRRNSTELLQQHALENEREREASQNVRPGTIHRMQFTFSVDEPWSITASAVISKMSNLKPSLESKDTVRRGRPSTWYTLHNERPANRLDSEEDVDMKVATADAPFPPHTARAESASEDDGMLKSSALRNTSRLSIVEDVVPRTITPSHTVGPNSSPGAHTTTTGKRPSVSVRTRSVSTRSTATPVNASQQNSTSNSAPGGVKAKAECSNCGVTHTSLWRSGLNNDLNCNACGLYRRKHKRPRPKGMLNNGKLRPGPKTAPHEGKCARMPLSYALSHPMFLVQCYNCYTTATPLWRKDKEGKTVCNACGLYYKVHGSARPMKLDVFRKHPVGNSETPRSARRASPIMESTPTLAPDSTTQTSYNENENGDGNMDYYCSFMQCPSSHVFDFSDSPYHSDFLSQLYTIPNDALPFSSSSSDTSESRSSKRRRLSNDSASEPPSSAVSYSDSFNMLRGGTWHPPMLPSDGSPNHAHPPGLPGSEDSPMYPPMVQGNDETDA
ncbi:hypothetical protein C8Q74DRAFT_1394854, partial [Fomes fomentarius]